jgi:MFS family permease
MAPTSEGTRPSEAQAWWAVAVLYLAGVLSHIDRTILSLLVIPLKRDLGLSEVQVGLLSGLAFASIYAIAAIPIAGLSDKGSRRGIIAVGVAFWSVSTAACGLVYQYAYLFVARMGVGVGEAVLTPAAFSLIADLFPKERRGFALALFGASVATGTGLALIIGGLIVQWVDHFGTIQTWIGPLRSWQFVFIAVGIPGVLVSLLAMTMFEPRHMAQKTPDVPLSELMAFIRKNLGILLLMFLANSFAGLIATGYAAWAFTYFIRVIHLTPGVVGVWSGVTIIICAPLGGWLGGYLLKRWTVKGHIDAPLMLSLFGMSFVIPSYILTTQMPSWPLALLFQAFGFIFGAIPYIAGASSVQLITPPRLRARISAIYFMFVTLIAIGGGPAVVAYITEYVFRDTQRVGDSISLTSALMGPFMLGFIMLARKRFREAAKLNMANN